MCIPRHLRLFFIGGPLLACLSANGTPLLDEANTLLERKQYVAITQLLSGLPISQDVATPEQLARLYFLRGFSQVQRLRYANAKADFQTAYNLNPDSVEIIHWFGIAERYRYGGDGNQNLGSRLLQKAASLGHAESSYQQAVLKLRQSTDDPEGIAALLAAIDGDHVMANLTYARMHKHGSGVKKDEQKAVQYFEAAAQLGNPEAQYELSLAYPYMAWL